MEAGARKPIRDGRVGRLTAAESSAPASAPSDTEYRRAGTPTSASSRRRTGGPRRGASRSSAPACARAAINLGLIGAQVILIQLVRRSLERFGDLSDRADDTPIAARSSRSICLSRTIVVMVDAPIWYPENDQKAAPSGRVRVSVSRLRRRGKSLPRRDEAGLGHGAPQVSVLQARMEDSTA